MFPHTTESDKPIEVSVTWQDVSATKAPYKWRLVLSHGAIRAGTKSNVTIWQRFWTWFFFGSAIKWERVENNEV